MTYIPPGTRRRPQEVITASLPELVAQAVENERTKLLNELRRDISRIAVGDDKRGYWHDDDDKVKIRAKALEIIDRAY